MLNTWSIWHCYVCSDAVAKVGSFFRMYIISIGEGLFPACGSKGFAKEGCPSGLRWNSPCFSEKGIPSEMNSSVGKVIFGDTPNFMSIVPMILWSSSRFIMEAVFCGATRSCFIFRMLG